MTSRFSALPRTSPERAGIPRHAIDALVDRLADQDLDPHALLVVRGGKVAVEAAWQPYELAQPALVYSVSKTFTSIAIGLLADEGRLSLDDSVGSLLSRPNPHGLTVRHLLTMNTGHSAEQIERLHFVLDALLTTTPAHEPGTHFAYNSDATFALACIVTALTGERLTDYLRPRLLDPIGIGSRWMKPVHGTEQGFSGYHLTAEDIARVSILLGNGGRWDGVQLLSERYVDELSRAWSDTSAHEDATDENDWTLGYGYQVWRSRQGFRLDGAYGQFGLVIPELDLVVAYQGATARTDLTLEALFAFVAEVGSPAPEADADVPAVLDLDSWPHRSGYVPAADGAVDVTGWSLSDTDEGWMLKLPGGRSLPVRAETWTTTVVHDEGPVPAELPPQVDAAPVEPGTHVRLATRGERTAAGEIVVHVVNTTSPHRILLRRDADGVLSAVWHTVPLQSRALAGLRVPEAVARG